MLQIVHRCFSSGARRIFDVRDSSFDARHEISLFNVAATGRKRSSAKKPVIISIHGLISDADTASRLLTASQREGFACGAFQFPNDQSIEESARLLMRELRRFKQKYPDRHITLVTHSMEALVAGAVVENPSLDPGCVDCLIMIGPPNHGSLLPQCSFCSDVFEHVAAHSRRDCANLFQTEVEDGLGEAAHDLMPGSPFLHQLNARD